MTPATAFVGMGEKNEWRGASIFSSKIVPGCKQKTIKAIISAQEKDTLHVRSSHKKTKTFIFCFYLQVSIFPCFPYKVEMRFSGKTKIV